MIVLSALVNAKLLDHGSAHRVVREHTANCLIDDQLGLGFHQTAIWDFLHSADVAGVTAIKLLIQLLAGKDGLLGIDDDHMIAAVHIRGKGRLVFCRGE